VSFRATALVLVLLLSGAVCHAEVMPPPPAAHFNDYASLVSPATAAALDARLADFERQTSDQFVVAIYPKLQSSSSIEDYAVRVAQSWKVGLKGKDNGVVLFIFAQSHQVYIQVGYGLEGALPDALAKRIISDEIVPRFRAGDYDGGVTAAVNAVIAATKGEYRGTGSTVADGRSTAHSAGFFLGIAALIIAFSFLFRSNSMYSNGGRRGVGLPWIFMGGGGGFSGGGGGGGFSGGGGGFSGGGGGFGGGGAGGSW
jgi:uncharacterized protein